MILRNLQFSLKKLKNQKLFTFVNLTGLAIGIIAGSFILIYIKYELSFDRFNKNSKRIARVYLSYTLEGRYESYAQTSTQLATFLQNKFSEVEKTVRIRKVEKCLVSSGEKYFFEEGIILADSTIFDVFTFPLLIGNPKEVLTQPNSVVLTESTAEKYFGKIDPLGKTLRYNRSVTLTVTGVMKNIPDNTHLKFDMVASMLSAKVVYGDDFLINRMNPVVFTYLLINQDIDMDRFDKSICMSTEEYYESTKSSNNVLFNTQPLTSIHLHSNMSGEYAPNSDDKYIYILSSVALLILIIACINYINLSLSINNQRTTELGIRKIMGAKRIQLIFLYLSDASFLVGISVIISAVIIIDQLDWFGNLVGADLKNTFSLKSLITGLTFLFVIITMITGLSSGWIISRINPMDALKKSLVQTKKQVGKQGILVLFQFTISIILISSSLFIYRQMRFIKNTNLGFSKEQLIIIPLNDESMKLKIVSFKQGLLNNPNIISAGASSNLPGGLIWLATINYEEKNEQLSSHMASLKIDKDFINTYRIQLKEGFLPGDTANPYIGTQYLLNESAVKKLGWNNPIGKKFSCYDGKEGFVTGVIRDFHFKSLHSELEPLFLYMREDAPLTKKIGAFDYLAVKLSTTDISGSVNYIQRLWNKMVPDSPFEYFFYDNFYNQLYKKESTFGKIIFIFSSIAIIIACMGLFSLAVFFSDKRGKEIGLRKVNGATIFEIISLLNLDFVKWVLIAYIIAIPITWYAMQKWIQPFAYKIELSWWIFAIAGVIALGFTILTVSWQSWRAATRNPVDILRYE